MIPSKQTLIIAAGAIVLTVAALWGGSAWAERHHKAKAEAAQLLVEQAKGEAKITREAAIKSDEKAAQAETAKLSADEKAATAKRELARLRAGLVNKPPFISNPGVSAPGPGADHNGNSPSVEGVAQLQATVSKQDEVIAAQDQQIKVRDNLISQMTVSRDEWKATAGHLQDQADAQKLAADEWRKAVGSGERRAAIKWGVIGLGVGFLVGKR